MDKVSGFQNSPANAFSQQAVRICKTSDHNHVLERVAVAMANNPQSLWPSAWVLLQPPLVRHVSTVYRQALVWKGQWKDRVNQIFSLYSMAILWLWQRSNGHLENEQSAGKEKLMSASPVVV